MENTTGRKRRKFYFMIFTASVAMVCLITALYVSHLNRIIAANITSSISEIAIHDKAAIQTYIDICQNDLLEIRKRFTDYGLKTIHEIETQMNLERASSGFTHIYLVAENGNIYTDKYVTYVPSHRKNKMTRYPDFFPCFSGGKEKVVARFDETIPGGHLSKESIIYGVRLHDFIVEDMEMFALIGISDISSIQDKMVINSFIKDGTVRGHSALIDMEGNYIINVDKNIYLNRRYNLLEHITEADQSELTADEVLARMSQSRTFGFYHYHEGDRNKEQLYFMPFENDIGLYFVMSVSEEVFMEQTRSFVILSISMLAFSMFTVISMLLLVMRFQLRTIRSTEAARSQKEFLSNMSHEIRTPLNGLIGMNHLIMVHIDDESRKPQIKEWLKKSHSTANYLLSLVNDVLDMSKLQAGKVEIYNEALSVSCLVDEIAAMQADNIHSRGVEFIVEKDIIRPFILGDATRIKQILMNIVGNAAKFTPEGNYIRLSVRQHVTDGQHVTNIFECEDTGIGMSSDYIGKIFDSFTQEQNRGASGIKGTGLGMAISRLLVNAMDGDITVKSEYGVGSTFTVTIPSEIVTGMPDMRPVCEVPDNLNRTPAEHPVKILVAEDVDLNAEILLEILTMEGFETAHARNGREALELFARSAPGEFYMILMDMQMPEMDGCQACREIRKLERPDASSVLIYACTANTFQEDRQMAIQSGMNDFLTKPIDVSELLKKIQNKPYHMEDPS